MVATDKFPVNLFYVPHLDQVWVLNWRSTNNTGIKTIQVLALKNARQNFNFVELFQVIRDAGQKRKHHTVHPDPIDGQFDLVKGLFIPSANQVATFSKRYISC